MAAVSPPYVSLFSGAGLGDLGWVEAGLDPLLLAEIDPRRAALAARNHPRSLIVDGDVATEVARIESATRSALDGRELFLLAATPPCQGMSKNGMGSLLQSKRRGLRPRTDPRNQLYRPVLDLVDRLRPVWLFFENVCRLMNTYGTQDDGEPRLVVELMTERLRRLGYRGQFQRVQLADYGLPQNRLRTVGLFRRCDLSSATPAPALPPPSHGATTRRGIAPWRTLRDAIGHLPELDARSAEGMVSAWHPLHRVPRWRSELAEWMVATPEGRSAFDNRTCSRCGIAEAGDRVVCRACGAPLARPCKVVDGQPRLIRGFPSAYKRMSWARPGSTVTTRSAYACSDHKVHPTQHRVLSAYEVCLLQGIDPQACHWQLPHPRTGALRQAPDGLIRDVVGECVPPSFAALVGQHLRALEAPAQALP